MMIRPLSIGTASWTAQLRAQEHAPRQHDVGDVNLAQDLGLWLKLHRTDEGEEIDGIFVRQVGSG